MASVVEFPAGRGFQFTIKKHWTATPAEPWVNTYWAVSIGAGTLNDLISLGRLLTNFERIMTRDLVTFDTWSVRTGAREDPPTSENFYIEPVNLPGLYLSSGVHMLDKRVVLWITKAVLTGRQGRAFLRGVLSEEDVESVAGQFALTTVAAAALATRLAAAKDVISHYFNGGESEILRLSLLKWNGTDVRYWTDVLMNAVTICKHNHAYFDIGAARENNWPSEITLPGDVNVPNNQYAYLEEDPVP